MVSIQPVNNVFTRFAKSDIGQKMYKSILNPKKESFWDNTMPLIETTMASGFYIVSAGVQKDIDPKSKKAIQIQNILSWLVSIGLSIPMNKRLSKFGAKLVQELEKTNTKKEVIQDLHKVTSGIKIGLPLATVTLLNRYIIPSVLVPISSIIRDKSTKKLD